MENIYNVEFTCKTCGEDISIDMDVPTSSFGDKYPANENAERQDCPTDGCKEVFQIYASTSGQEVCIDIDGYDEDELDYENSFEFPYEEDEVLPYSEILSNADKCIKELILFIEHNDKEESGVFNKVTYAHVITIFEAYLCDTFISVLSENKKLFTNFLQNICSSNNDSDRQDFLPKVKSKDLYQLHSKNIKTSVLEHIRENVSFHNTKKVVKLFEYAFGFNLQIPDKVVVAVNTRHHIIHRAGKDDEGNSISISADEVFDLAIVISRLVFDVAENVQKEIHKLEAQQASSQQQEASLEAT